MPRQKFTSNNQGSWSNNNNASGKRQRYANIASQTLQSFEQGYYLVNGERVEVAELQQFAVDNTRVFTPRELNSDAFQEQVAKQIDEIEKVATTITVEDLSVLVAAQQLTSVSQNVCVLNFASGRNPGGGFLKGSSAQEETLARSSGLYPCLIKPECSVYYDSNQNEKTCLYTDHIIYSPKVPFIKNDEGTFLSAPYCSSVITAPAVNAGVYRSKFRQKNNAQLQQEIDIAMKKRIHYILQIAALQNADSLVLGAYGCGVFKNDPRKVAGYFKNWLDSEEFAGVFKHVCFAIYGVGANFTAFEETFIRN